MANGVGVDESAFVFAKPGGSPLYPNYVSQTFERLVAQTDIPRILLHDLRHTHASILLRAHAPREKPEARRR